MCLPKLDELLRDRMERNELNDFLNDELFGELGELDLLLAAFARNDPLLTPAQRRQAHDLLQLAPEEDWSFEEELYGGAGELFGLPSVSEGGDWSPEERADQPPQEGAQALEPWQYRRLNEPEERSDEEDEEEDPFINFDWVYEGPVGNGADRADGHDEDEEEDAEDGSIEEEQLNEDPQR